MMKGSELTARCVRSDCKSDAFALNTVGATPTSPTKFMNEYSFSEKEIYPNFDHGPVHSKNWDDVEDYFLNQPIMMLGFSFMIILVCVLI